LAKFENLPWHKIFWVYIPDLESAYLGLKLLENLGAIVRIDWKRTEYFMLSCLSQLGFNCASASVIAEAPNTHLVPHLNSTYLGLKLLEHLASKEQNPHKFGLKVKKA